MTKNFKLKHKLWVKNLLSDTNWQAGLTFGLSSRSIGMYSTKSEILTQLKSVKKFETKLIKFCKGFDFNIEKPAGIEYFDFIMRQQTCKLESYEIAEQLIHTLETSRNAYQLLEKDLATREALNKKRRFGPLKTPYLFAEHVLAGIHLHNNSTDGMKLLRIFLEPKGKLEKWLAENSRSKDMHQTLISTTGDREDIRKWAAKKRQIMERIILSYELGKDVKSFKNHSANLKSLRERVSNRVQDILGLLKKLV